MSEDVLKDCPFCGGEPTEHYIGPVLELYCSQCGVRFPLSKKPERTIETWNTRAGEQAAYERGKADGLEEARLNLARRIKEQSQEIATQERAQERGRIVAGVNNLITEYIKSPGIGFSNTMTAKMALEDAINIVNQVKE